MLSRLDRIIEEVLYPFFVRFCFSVKKYALFHSHFCKSISALSIDCYILIKILLKNLVYER